MTTIFPSRYHEVGANHVDVVCGCDGIGQELRTRQGTLTRCANTELSPAFAQFVKHADRADKELSRILHRAQLGYLDYLIVVPGMAFGTYFMPLTIGLICYCHKERTKIVYLTVASSICTVLVSEVLKKSTRRARPNLEGIAPRAFNLRGLLSNYSFPSGDTAQAGVAGTILAFAGTSRGLWPVLPLSTMYAVLQHNPCLSS